MKYPGTFTIYKKIGASQFTLINPKVKQDSGRIDRDGAVLLEAAKGVANKKYLWSEKISFALGMSDLCNIFENPDAPKRLIHSMPGSDTVKALEFEAGEGAYAGTYMMKLSETNKKSNVNKLVTVPISGGEYTVLLRLLMAAAPKMIGW